MFLNLDQIVLCLFFLWLLFGIIAGTLVTLKKCPNCGTRGGGIICGGYENSDGIFGYSCQSCGYKGIEEIK